MAAVPSLFVGGLPSHADEDLVRRMFEQFGQVEKVTVKKNFAFVLYTEQAAVEAAVAMDGQELEGKKLGVRIQSDDNRKPTGAALAPVQPVQLPGVPISTTGNPSLFVGSLPAGTTEAEVQALVAPFGTVASIVVKKGFAFATFVEPGAAHAACSLDGQAYGDKTLGVRIQSAENVKTKPPQMAIPSGFPVPAAMGVMGGGAGKQTGGPNSLFMGGLPSHVTEAEIRSVAEPYGAIASVALFKGYAFVNYLMPGSAQLAASYLDGVEYNGKKLGVRVQSAGRPSAGAAGAPMMGGLMMGGGQMMSPMGMPAAAPAPSGPKPWPSLFVGGVPASLTERELRLLLSPYGTVTGISMRKGYCFVDYGADGCAAQAAAALDGYNVDGKTLGVRVQEGEHAGKTPRDAAKAPRFAPY